MHISLFIDNYHLISVPLVPPSSDSGAALSAERRLSALGVGLISLMTDTGIEATEPRIIPAAFSSSQSGLESFFLSYFHFARLLVLHSAYS